MRLLVLHPDDRWYGRRVAEDLEANGEVAFTMAAIAPTAAAALCVDAWLDVVDRVIVYCDRGTTSDIVDIVRTAEALGVGVEHRCVGDERPSFRERIADWIEAW